MKFLLKTIKARYYDPNLGRFINQDPIRDGNNWHVYSGGNPVLFSDPRGTSYDYNEAVQLLGGDSRLFNDYDNLKQERVWSRRRTKNGQ